ncbi:winged helix-turn-helix domain-containing protein [Spirillospora sp. NPDC029432]|uniref:winged helix-turn-helix domain-containing protein n=1 Tax=Spirillospora sp. NPDC029432 TaxID=3154599 RepID=UPI003454A8C1
MVQRSGRPGYLQIADDLRQQVADGRLAPGDALPSTAQLREQYDVSAGVVKAAISVLRTEGVVVGQQGKGVFIRDRSGTGEPPAQSAQAAEESTVMAQLTEVLGAVRELGERVARLEASVYPEPQKARRSGK